APVSLRSRRSRDAAISGRALNAPGASGSTPPLCLTGRVGMLREQRAQRGLALHGRRSQELRDEGGGGGAEAGQVLDEQRRHDRLTAQQLCQARVERAAREAREAA